MIDIDLVLSGSGVRFGAHFGAIKALQELGYNPVRVAGSSGGAIAGAMYCAGISIESLIQEFYRIDLKDFRSVSIWGTLWNWGLYSNENIAKRLNEMTGGLTIKDTKKEFTAVATGEVHGVVLLNKNTAPDLTLGQAAAMSSAVPGYFQRYTWKDDALYDGGLIKNYPIDIYDEKRELIGLHIKGDRAIIKERSRNPFTALTNLLKIVLRAFEKEHIEDASWAKTIRINTEDIEMLDFEMSLENRKRLVQMGYDAVKEWHERNN